MSDEGGVSRRDFLRRASQKAAKDAVEVGTQVVPGGAVIRRMLEDTPVMQGDTSGEETSTASTPLKNPLQWIARWRNRRAEPQQSSEDEA